MKQSKREISDYLKSIRRRKPADPDEPKIGTNERRIRRAKHIGELLAALSGAGEIFDPKTGAVYTAAYLKPLINGVWQDQNPVAVEEVPDVMGLRDKMRELKK